MPPRAYAKRSVEVSCISGGCPHNDRMQKSVEVDVKKELFIENLELIKKLEEVGGITTSALSLVGAMSMIDFSAVITHLVEVAKLIGDPDNWIEWWVYESDCGKDKESIQSVKVNGKFYDLTTPEQLYLFLVNYE